VAAAVEQIKYMTKVQAVEVLAALEQVPGFQ
jgi:hypothetical protein